MKFSQGFPIGHIALAPLARCKHGCDLKRSSLLVGAMLVSAVDGLHVALVVLFSLGAWRTPTLGLRTSVT